MERIEDMIALKRIKELLAKEEQEDCFKTAIYILGGIALIIGIVALCIAIVKFFQPDKLDDLENEFDDDFDDDFFDDEEAEVMENGTGA